MKSKANILQILINYLYCKNHKDTIRFG